MGRKISVYDRLAYILRYEETSPEAFREELRKALGSPGGFDINEKGENGLTLLHHAVSWRAAAGAGVPKLLLDAGADAEMETYEGDTPFSLACLWFIKEGAKEFLGAAALLLQAGARTEESFDLETPRRAEEEEKRRLQLLNFINSLPARRARDRAADVSPDFDYAL